MKKALLFIAFTTILVSSLAALPAGVLYTEGEASIRFKGGSERDADIGDILNTGDTVKTGYDGLVELDQKGARFQINADTVFTLMEKEKGGKTTGVLSIALGSVKFRYDRLTGREPLIQSHSCIAGVRGTELSVYAGVDGSALILVDRGSVIVEAERQSVELAPEEGVEVRPGRPPGEKFRVPAEKIDYRAWNEEKLRDLMADPLAALQSVQEQLESYIAQADRFHALYSEHNARLQAERGRQRELAGKDQLDEARRLEKEVVFPLAVQTGNLLLNVRYYSLAALSLRRFIAGRMYLWLKTRYILASPDSLYDEFLTRYEVLLARFEQAIVPHLVEADI